MFKGLLKMIKPSNLDEITALVSLGRPGPLQSEMHLHFAESKFDPSKRMKYHPLIDELMDETHGSIIYQEQVMAIGQKMGGFTMGGADKLRKAMGKKKVEEMEKQKSLFIEGATKKNVDPALAEEIFETVETFAGYGFNKSHAMSYSFLTYKMAYLRQHYPTEFMSAVLTVDANGGEFKKKIAKDVESMKEVGLFLYTPNINESEGRFRPGKTNGILYGFDGIAGFSKKDKETVFEARNESKFTSLEDFMKRAVCGAVVEKLIDSGAMDSLGLLVKPNEENLEYIKSLDKVEQKVLKRRLLSGECFILKNKLSKKEHQSKYVMGSFDEKEIQKAYSLVVKAYKANKDKLIAEGLDREEKVLSSYVTAHPLDVGGARHEVIKKTKKEHVKLSSVASRAEENINAEVNVAGIVKEIVHGRISKTGNKYAFIEISDGSKVDRIFLSDEGFNKVNSQIKAKNGVGLEEGDVVGFDLSFYKKEGDEEFKTSAESFIVPKYDIAENISRKKKNKQKYSNR
jgi:DNA polymerase-3 subunit alpha